MEGPQASPGEASRQGRPGWPPCVPHGLAGTLPPGAERQGLRASLLIQTASRARGSPRVVLSAPCSPLEASFHWGRGGWERGVLTPVAQSTLRVLGTHFYPPCALGTHFCPLKAVHCGPGPQKQCSMAQEPPAPHRPGPPWVRCPQRDRASKPPR